jgi:hypothetical protein
MKKKVVQGFTVGNFMEYNSQPKYNIARLNLDGTLDTTFSDIDGTSLDYIYTITIQPDNKIIIGGWFSLPNSFDDLGLAR